MSEVPLTSYEELPYESKPFAYTHPDCLATVATLYGMKPTVVEQCRVLELGCADGGNLIPMAVALPGSRFLGIDLSPRQIASGQAVVDALALPNIELKARSITDFDESFGQFDYIICHGVYSWVPALVQDKILAICARQLAPNGVAYVSYNVYPGWHMRGMIRELMCFHGRQYAAADVRVREARAFLDFLVDSVADPNSNYARLLKQEAEMLKSESDTYLFHEHLEDVNQPVYFHQFAGRAAAQGLQYIGEAKPSALTANLPPRVRYVLEQLSPDRIHREQYVDFLCIGTFRRSLLCHGEVNLQPAPSAKMIQGMHATGHVRPVAEHPDIQSTQPEEFRAVNGSATLTTNRPLVKAALCYLHEVWPRSVPFEVVWAEVQGRLGGQDQCDGEAQLLADILLHCYLSHLVELSVRPPRFALEISERPMACRLARLQAETGHGISNRRHRTVELDDGDRWLLPHLDGQRDRMAIERLLAEALTSGTLEAQQDGAPVRDAANMSQVLSESVEGALHRLARSALLVG